MTLFLAAPGDPAFCREHRTQQRDLDIDRLPCLDEDTGLETQAAEADVVQELSFRCRYVFDLDLNGYV
jgi:hypothetical protein